MISKNELYIKEINQKIRYLESREQCRDFILGKCTRGAGCRFSHTVVHPEGIPKKVMMADLYGDSEAKSADEEPEDCFYWMRGSCKFANNCSNIHAMEKYGTMQKQKKNAAGAAVGGRKRSSSHGTLQSFQRGSGLRGSGLDPVAEENLPSIPTMKQMEKQLEMFKNQNQLGMMEIPQRSHSKGAKEAEIQELQGASQNIKFQAQMALARLESLKTAAAMTGDRNQMSVIQSALARKGRDNAN